MNRSWFVALLSALAVIPTARAEVNVGSSLEWLTCEAERVVVGRVEKVVVTRAPRDFGDVLYHEFTVAVRETICGPIEERVVFVLRSYSPATDALPSAWERSSAPTLFFLTTSRKTDANVDGKLVPVSGSNAYAVFDLAAPGKFAFDANLAILKEEKAILAVCRATATKRAEHLKRHPNGRVEANQISADDSPAGTILYAGSATFLKVPVFVPGDPAPPLPEKTPFDGDQKKRQDYLRSYREGYQWAQGVHLVCPTNPSPDNLHAIRGWIEGWQAGVKAGGTGDLPAKYSAYLLWKDEKPAPLEPRWEVAKFPKLTGKLVKFLGHADGFAPPAEGDPFVLDFAALDRLKVLEFKPTPKGTHLPLYGPLQLVHVNTYTTGALASCRFESRSGDHSLRVDIHQKPGRGDPRFVEVIVTTEVRGLVTMAAVVEGLRDGDFPPPR